MEKPETLHLTATLDKLAMGFEHLLTPERKMLYVAMLMDLPLGDALAACESWLASDSSYFPRPGQLRTLALNLPSNPQASAVLKARAEQAWGNLRVTATEAYNRWALEDPLTAQVFRIMGGGFTTGAGFGRWDVRQEGLKHREFVATYLDVAQQYHRDHREVPALPLGAPVFPRLPVPAPAPETEDHRAEVHRLIADVIARLSLPVPGVPRHYQIERAPGNSLTYVPSLTPDELEARKALLLRQGQAVMAQELARQHMDNH